MYYVLGFLLDIKKENVVLIKKTKPEWQIDHLNGLGGTVELFDDTLHAAMVREFEEETGIVINNWKEYAFIEYPTSTIVIFKSFVEDLYKLNLSSPTEEIVGIYPIKDLPNLRIVSYLNWLIPMALDDNLYSTIKIS